MRRSLKKHAWKIQLQYLNLNKCDNTFNPLTPELNHSTQRCLTRFFTKDFASCTVHFVKICVIKQQIHQSFIQFINYVW
jgi:hypothetical protein